MCLLTVRIVIYFKLFAYFLEQQFYRSTTELKTLRITDYPYLEGTYLHTSKYASLTALAKAD